MKVSILYEFVDGPWGGGNTFLQALRKSLRLRNLYVESLDEADMVIYNLNPDALSFLPRLRKLKKQNPDTLVVGRLDGPIYQIRERDLVVDRIFYYLTEKVLDGIIYQSRWSQEENHKQKAAKQENEIVIHNASDGDIFYPIEGKGISNPTRLLCTSWSSNLKKGFDTYKWLDENLDFSKYEFEFIGNSPYQFTNIINTPPLEHSDMVKKLQSADIFITASAKDPCSNSLVEGLSCGMPAIAMRDGGHPELVGSGGELFDQAEEIPDLIKKIEQNYDAYVSNIKVNNFEQAAEQYINFLKEVLAKNKTGNPVKKFTLSSYAIIYLMIGRWYLQRAKRKFFSS